MYHLKILALISFFVYFGGQVSFAMSQKITLLSALPLDPSFDFVHLDELFKASFGGQGYDLNVVYEATQYDLWQSLHSSTTVALLWLSHAGCSNLFLPHYAHQVAMPDAHGLDASDILREIHPNLRFLGIIACNSAAVIQNTLQAKHYPNLAIKAFSQKITPEFGLLEAIAKAKEIIQKEEVTSGYAISHCPRYKGYPLTLKPTSSGPSNHRALSALRIRTKERTIIGMFQGGYQNEPQELKIFFPLPKNIQSPSHLDLFFEAGRAALAHAQPHLGEIEVVSSWPGGKWSMNPFLQGSTIRILSYQGTSTKESLEELLIAYEPFPCFPMPALNRHYGI